MVLEATIFTVIVLLFVPENISLWGGCIGPVMSNAIFGRTVTPLSLELAQWLWVKSLLRLVTFSRAHC